jgi:hypothetical protein
MKVIMPMIDTEELSPWTRALLAPGDAPAGPADSVADGLLSHPENISSETTRSNNECRIFMAKLRSDLAVCRIRICFAFLDSNRAFGT